MSSKRNKVLNAIERLKLIERFELAVYAMAELPTINYDDPEHPEEIARCERYKQRICNKYNAAKNALIAALNYE